MARTIRDAGNQRQAFCHECDKLLFVIVVRLDCAFAFLFIAFCLAIPRIPASNLMISSAVAFWPFQTATINTTPMMLLTISAIIRICCRSRRASFDFLTLMKFEKYSDKKLKGDYWRFDVTIGGQRYRHGGFLRKKDAEDAVAALRVFAQRTAYGLAVNLPEVTVADLLAKLNADKTVARQIRRMLTLFAAHCGERRPLRSLSRADLKSFADHLREQKPLANSSFSLYMANLKTALYRAGDYFAELETWQPPRLPKLPGFNKRTTIVPPEVVGAFLRELEKPVWHADRPASRKSRRDVADIIRLMCLLGARREEIEKITIGKIDWERRTLSLWSSKTKRDHLVPLSDLAVAVLQQRAPLKSGRLFSEKLKSCDITYTMNKARGNSTWRMGVRPVGRCTICAGRRLCWSKTRDCRIPPCKICWGINAKTSRPRTPRRNSAHCARPCRFWKPGVEKLTGFGIPPETSRDLQRLQQKSKPHKPSVKSTLSAIQAILTKYQSFGFFIRPTGCN